MQRGRLFHAVMLTGTLALIAGVARSSFAAALPDGWTNQDIAKTAPKTPGSTTFDSSTNVWTVTGTGGDVWDTADAGFQFAYTTLNGDGGITARLLTQVGGADTDWSKTGTMLRESTVPNSADAFLSYPSATGGKNSRRTFSRFT